MTKKKNNSDYPRITFCCSKDEQLAIRNVAADCGMSVSSYCKNVVLGHKPKYRLTPEQVRLMQDNRKLIADMQRLSNFFKNGEYYKAVAEIPVIVEQLKSNLYDCNR